MILATHKMYKDILEKVKELAKEGNLAEIRALVDESLDPHSKVYGTLVATTSVYNEPGAQIEMEPRLLCDESQE